MPDNQVPPVVDQQRTANPLRDALERIGKMSNRVRFSENATTREIDQLRAENARLREALEKINQPDTWLFDGADGIPGSIEVAVCCWCGQSETIRTKRVEHDDGCPIALARAALTADPGEWLEGVKRRASVATLEALPCYYYARGKGQCLELAGTEPRFFERNGCHRCRALAALKGEK